MNESYYQTYYIYKENEVQPVTGAPVKQFETLGNLSRYAFIDTTMIPESDNITVKAKIGLAGYEELELDSKAIQMRHTFLYSYSALKIPNTPNVEIKVSRLQWTYNYSDTIRVQKEGITTAKYEIRNVEDDKVVKTGDLMINQDGAYYASVPFDTIGNYYVALRFSGPLMKEEQVIVAKENHYTTFTIEQNVPNLIIYLILGGIGISIMMVVVVIVMRKRNPIMIKRKNIRKRRLEVLNVILKKF